MVRSGMTAGALVVLTVAGHTGAGGAAPDAVGLAAVMVLALGLTVATSARPPRPLRLLGFLLGGQALLHVVLTMSGTHGHTASIAGPSTAAMIGAHVAAGLVATVVLLHADDLIDRWQTLLLTALGVVPAEPPTIAAARPVEVAHASARSLDALLHQVVRRGPPAAVPA